MGCATRSRVKRSLSVAVLVVTIFVGASAAHAQENSRQTAWPQFHGPKYDNISRETGLLKTWPDDGPRTEWVFSDCGRGFSGVSVADGKIFTAGDFEDGEMVLALDMAGHPLWKSPNGESWTGAYPGSRTTPTYRDDMVYQMNPTGRLAAYRARSGEEVWAVELCVEFGAKYGTWAMAENVAVEGDLLFCIPGGSKALMVALDKNTGATTWTNTELEETAAYCSPILTTYQGVRQLITLTQKSVIGVDVKTGKLLWSHPHVTQHDQNVTAPLFSDGYVFATSGHSGGGRLLEINADGRGVKELWWNEDLDNCHGGVILLDGHLYGSACRSGGKGFFCADFMTGEVRYRDKRMEKLSLTCADGMLYGLTQRGEVLLIAPSPERLDVAGNFQLPLKDGDPAFAHPVVCNGRLYVRHGRHLYAYDIRGGDAS